MARSSFDKYLATLGAVVMASLVVIGAGCAQTAPSVSSTPTAINTPTPTPTPVPAPTPVPTPTPTPTPVPTPVPTPTPVTTFSYKNGTYSASGNYFTEGEPETIGVTVTVKDDVVTGASIQNQARNGTSQQYQNLIVDAFGPFVTGKKLSDINPMRVSGSSLTTIGLNAALSKIQSQAKA